MQKTAHFLRKVIFVLTWAILASAFVPYPVKNAPIGLFYTWQGMPFEQFPFFESWAIWSRLAVLILGSLICLNIYRNFEDVERQKRLVITCAGTVMTLALVSASLKEIVVVLITWLPFWTVLILAPSQRKSIFIWLCTMLAAQILGGLFAYIIHHNQYSSPGVGERASGFFGTPNGMYPLAMIGALLFLSSALIDGRKWLRWIGNILFLLSFLLLILTYSRSGWLGLAAGLLILAWRIKNHAVWLLPLVGCLIFASLVIRSNGTTEISSDRSYQGRMISIREGWTIFKEHSILGSGPNAFAQSNAYLKMKTHSSLVPYEPKNLYLHLAIEYGFIGLIFYLGLGVFPLSLSAVRVSISPLFCTVQSTMVALSVAGVFDTPIFSNLIRLPSTLTLLLLLAFCLKSEG